MARPRQHKVKRPKAVRSPVVVAPGGIEEEVRRLSMEVSRLRLAVSRKPLVAAGDFQCPNVNGTVQVVGGCNFLPHVLSLFVTAGNATNALHNGWGFAINSDEEGIQQYAQAIRGTSAGPTMARSRAFNRAIVMPDAVGGSVLVGEVTEFSDDGFSITFHTASDAYQVFWMALG